MRPVPSVLDLVSRRLALPRSHRGLIGTERVLAFVRLFLAFSSLLLLRLKPQEAFPYGWAVALTLVYSAHALGLLVTFWSRREITPRTLLGVHAVDIVWAAIIGIFAVGAEGPFFLYLIFALLAAALRWGMRETALTTVALVAAMALDSVARAHISWLEFLGQPSPENFVLRTIYLLIFAFLIGYIAEAEKRGAAEALSISSLSSKVRVEAGLKGTVQVVMHEMLTLFGGKELLVITREAQGQLVMLWRTEKREDGAVFTWRQLDETEQQEYLCVMGEDSAGAAWRDRNTTSTITLDKNGMRTQGEQCYLAARFVAEHPFRLLIACAISAAPDVSARLLLFEPRLGGRPETQLRFLQDLANLVAPSVYNVYLLRRLRSRAGHPLFRAAMSSRRQSRLTLDAIAL